MNNIIVSFSGGRTSAFMARQLQLKHKGTNTNLIYIFANTGKERIETLDFINECDLHWNPGVIWVEYDIVNNKSDFKKVSYINASRNGEPFEKMIKKYGISNKSFPHCTRELKKNTIRRYLRSISLNNKDYKTAIGIRSDEQHRINWLIANKENLIYPLATDLKVNSQYIRDWWNNQPFDLQLKDYEGNCDLCWKKSERKLLTLIIENPQLLNWWNDMEIKYGNDEFVFFRNNKSALDLLDLSKTKRFLKAKDLYELSSTQLNLFDPELDIEYDCFCKST